ncbi:type II secretion system F family protein [Ruegeria sp.]|uniref:type II secretion system F family protein n=1 Tax=Ruegeria sp. TaxID=1879320 RepID=UPI003C7A38F8
MNETAIQVAEHRIFSTLRSAEDTQRSVLSNTACQMPWICCRWPSKPGWASMLRWCDGAMVRVSHEMAQAAPEISQEFSILQLELQAGKERQAAFLDMAERVGIDEMNSFANAFLQSNQYGTSISASLRRFATDMRLDHELRAQEKANRLPVQMSAVMAMCRMPVLLLICLAPMLIRWINMFG